MENLFIEQTETSPKIVFDIANQTYEIIGRSFPEDPTLVFEPVLRFIERVFPSIMHPIKLIVETEYFNSSSSRYMLIILRKLADLYAIGKPIIIVWRFDDEELRADGELYQNLVKIPFEFDFVDR